MCNRCSTWRRPPCPACRHDDAALVADVLELVASAKDADAAATPGPEREYEPDGFSRALLM